MSPDNIFWLCVIGVFVLPSFVYGMVRAIRGQDPDR